MVVVVGVDEARGWQAEAFFQKPPQPFTFTGRPTAAFEPIVPQLLGLVPEAPDERDLGS